MPRLQGQALESRAWDAARIPSRSDVKWLASVVDRLGTALIRWPAESRAATDTGFFTASVGRASTAALSLLAKAEQPLCRDESRESLLLYGMFSLLTMASGCAWYEGTAGWSFITLASSRASHWFLGHVGDIAKGGSLGWAAEARDGGVGHGGDVPSRFVALVKRGGTNVFRAARSKRLSEGTGKVSFKTWLDKRIEQILPGLELPYRAQHEPTANDAIQAALHLPERP